jgi:hypothetical protein
MSDNIKIIKSEDGKTVTVICSCGGDFDVCQVNCDRCSFDNEEQPVVRARCKSCGKEINVFVG